MECPHCKNELKIPPRAYRHVETYSRTARVATECCEKLIVLSGSMIFRVRTGDDQASVDDWGVPVKK